MALEPIQLDDLTWSELATSARDQIAGVSGGEWTLHEPVDPGITLLELFAAQLEQRLYWMDQPSDELTRALLARLGVRQQPVRCARTLLCFQGPSPTPSEVPDGSSDGSDVAADVVPAHTVMEHRGLDRVTRFRTVEQLRLLPVNWRAWPNGRAREVRARIDLFVGGKDRTADLEAGRAPCMFPAQGKVRDATMKLHLNGTWEGSLPSDAPISLFFELETPAGLAPQWRPDSRGQRHVGPGTDSTRFDPPEGKSDNVPPPAQLTWLCGYESEKLEPIDPGGVEDGTGGLRRSGLVRLRLPPSAPSGDGSAERLGDAEVQPPEARKLVIEVRAENVAYSYLPRVKRIVPNAAIAEHRVRRAFSTREKEELDDLSPEERDLVEQICGRWTKLPGNELLLPNIEGDALPIPESITLWLREDAAECGQPVKPWMEWSFVDDFAFLGPDDRRFVVDRPSGRLRFGCGLNGRIPIPAKCTDSEKGSEKDSGEDSKKVAVRFELGYDVGGGPAGNVGPWLAWHRLENDPGARPAWSAVNVVSGEGGAEAESLDAAARRAAGRLRRPERAVTPGDFERLAEGAPGVATKRAHAAVGYHPQYPCTPVPGAVTVFLVPDLPASLETALPGSCGDDLVALRPDCGAIRAVADRLEQARLVTQEVYVCGPKYDEVDVRVTLAGEPLDRQSVADAVTGRLHAYLHPLYGGPLGEGWGFGEPVRPSELVRVAQEEVAGGLHVLSVEIRMRRSEGPWVHCEDVYLRSHALVALRDVAVVFAPASDQAGGLR